MKEIKAVAGERVKLALTFQGEPTPEAVWTKEGQDKPITSSKGLGISLTTTADETKLAFNNITKEQAGTYTLTVSNDSGKETVSSTIIVRGRPSPPENLSASLDGAVCNLYWKLSPDNGGAPIEHYQIERHDSEKGSWMACGRTKDNQFEAKGLLPGRQYKFRVTAVNRYGDSDAAESAEAINVGAPKDDGKDVSGRGT